MTERELIAALAPVSKLNSWARVPYEQTLGMHGSRQAIYAMKRMVITSAIELGMCDIRIVSVERSCKTCKGTGTFERWSYDEESCDYEECRRCTGTGRVTLRFAETAIAGYHWHTPRPRAEFLKLDPAAWEACEATDWTPEQPGTELSRIALITLLNEAERAVFGGKLIRWGDDWTRSNPFRYSLNLGEQTDCFVCGHPAVKQYSHLPTIHRPGLKWEQACCDPCEHKAERWPRQWPATLVNPRHDRGMWITDSPRWAMNVPLPAIAQTDAVREWLERRGIFEGLPVPGEMAFTAAGDLVTVVTIRDGSAYIRHLSGHWLFAGHSENARMLPVPASELRGWALKQLPESSVIPQQDRTFIGSGGIL